MNSPDIAAADNLAVAERGHDARDRILSAAESLFAVRGFEGVSTTQIAKVAGITQPLIHYHFKNKEALWKATLTRLFSKLSDEFGAEIKNLQRKDEQRYFVEVIRCYVGFVSRHPQYGQFILREGVQESARLQWMVDEWLRPMLDQFHEIYLKGRAEGWMKEIPFPQIIMMITASASHFFSMAPLVKALYDIDATCPDQTLAHADAVVELAVNALFRDPAPNVREVATA